MLIGEDEKVLLDEFRYLAEQLTEQEQKDAIQFTSDLLKSQTSQPQDID